jgi:hypothetical protein
MGWPETAENNYKSTLCNSPEEQISHLQRCESLNSLIVFVISASRTPEIMEGRWYSAVEKGFEGRACRMMSAQKEG